MGRRWTRKAPASADTVLLNMKLADAWRSSKNLCPALATLLRSHSYSFMVYLVLVSHRLERTSPRGSWHVQMFVGIDCVVVGSIPTRTNNPF